MTSATTRVGNDQTIIDVAVGSVAVCCVPECYPFSGKVCHNAGKKIDCNVTNVHCAQSVMALLEISQRVGFFKELAGEARLNMGWLA
jgi:hypothetical protein